MQETIEDKIVVLAEEKEFDKFILNNFLKKECFILVKTFYDVQQCKDKSKVLISEKFHKKRIKDYAKVLSYCMERKFVPVTKEEALDYFDKVQLSNLYRKWKESE